MTKASGLTFDSDSTFGLLGSISHIFLYSSARCGSEGNLKTFGTCFRARIPHLPFTRRKVYGLLS